jgi:hypothetical protein
MVSNKRRKQVVEDLIAQAERFRFCGPSDDPDEQTAVTSGYRYLVTQFKRLAAPVLPSASKSRLNAIEVEIDTLYSAYDAKAELDALIPEIETALECIDDADDISDSESSIVIAPSRLVELRSLVSPDFDFTKLVRLCEEVNTSYGLHCYYAAAMLIRSVLDHVPPIFGFRNFGEIANNYAGGGRSFKDAMNHLESASRKVADAHLHMPIRKSEILPTAHQVNCGQQLDLLLAEIVRITK